MSRPKPQPNGLFCETCGQPLTGRQRLHCCPACCEKKRLEYHKRWMEQMMVKVPGKDLRAVRTCLLCQKPFASTGPGNRICHLCIERDRFATRRAQPLRCNAPGEANRGPDE
jgi:hypothetical protein